MLGTPFGIVTLVRLLHSLNAHFPILVTLSGIVTLVRPLHPENAEGLMFVMPSGIVTFVNALHPDKLKVVTLLGNDMFASLVQL